MKSQKKGR